MLHAQSADSQQDSQDAAEAARKARARKQRAATERHVYTNEDLRRSRILTPEDQSRATAAKEKQQVTPSPKPETQPLDANSATPQEPLGDVARRYRNAKKISPFHLPTNQPELASPKNVAPIPELKPIAPVQPQPPARDFALAKPLAPTAGSSVPSAPVFPSSRAHRIDPFVGRRIEPLPPSNSYARSLAPAIVPPRPRTFAAVRPTISPETRSQVIVQPGDTLWAISYQHLGRGSRWLELMAANPNLPDPGRLVPGTVLSLPAKTTSSRSNHVAPTVTVQAGDTLSKLAFAAFGHASYWSCIAHANPTLSNPHRLAIGQSLTIPSSCAL